jgi:hypothetical protein
LLGFKKYEHFSLAVGGGLLVTSDFVRAATNDALQKNGLRFEMTVVNEPLTGCVRLASPEFAGTLVKWQ